LEDTGEFDGLVTLNAVSCVFDPKNHSIWSPAQKLSFIGIVDNRLREHAAGEKQRHRACSNDIPQSGEIGVFASRFHHASIPPDPRSIVELERVMQDASPE
jgi:hypothetical protein